MVKKVPARVLESIQLIHIKPNAALTPTAINYALQKARSNWMYAKFYTDTAFIQVNFMRDNTISVATNIRNPQCVNQLWKYNQQGWTFNSVKDFVYRWMQVNRKLIKQ
jgi:hypothetical protein